MCQLILGFLRRKAVIDGPIDCLRSHIDKCSESETLVLGGEPYKEDIYKKKGGYGN